MVRDSLKAELFSLWSHQNTGAGSPSYHVVLAPEALTSMFAKQIDGFGELFRMLSFEEIGSAAMLSRACAGIVSNKAIFLGGGRNGSGTADGLRLRGGAAAKAGTFSDAE